MSRAWFKLYGRDYRDGVRDLPWDVTGIYSVLLTFMYEEEGGRIKDHDQRLARLVGCDIRMWKRARATLIEAGKLSVTADGFLTNGRVEIEVKSAELLSEVRAKSGRSSRQLADSDKPKSLKTAPSPAAIAPDLSLYARALPESEPDKDTSLRSVSRRAKRKTAIAPDAVLNLVNRAYATDHQVVNGSADAMWEAFRDYHVAKGNLMADWDAAWRNWVRRSPEFRATPGKPQREGFSAIIDRVFAEEEAKRVKTG